MRTIGLWTVLFLIPVRWVGPVLSQETSQPSQTLYSMALTAGVAEMQKQWGYIDDGNRGSRVRLAPGWVGFDFQAAFGRPVKITNDAAMQALGSYKGGKMLFLGLGTGLGSALVVNGIVEPMELGHLPYKKGTYESYVGHQALEERGRRSGDAM